MGIQSLGQEDSLQKEMTIHSSNLAWEIPWTEKPGRLRGHERVRYGTVTKHHHRLETNVTLSFLEQLQRPKGLDVASYKNNTNY